MCIRDRLLISAARIWENMSPGAEVTASAPSPVVMPARRSRPAIGAPNRIEASIAGVIATAPPDSAISRSSESGSELPCTYRVPAVSSPCSRRALTGRIATGPALTWTATGSPSSRASSQSSRTASGGVKEGPTGARAIVTRAPRDGKCAVRALRTQSACRADSSKTG